MAQLVLYLASDKTGGITGQAIDQHLRQTSDGEKAWSCVTSRLSPSRSGQTSLACLSKGFWSSRRLDFLRRYPYYKKDHITAKIQELLQD